MALLLPNDRTFELYDRSREFPSVMGYVLSTSGAGETRAVDQVQRWILFSRSRAEYFPRKLIQIRQPSDAAWRAVVTKEDFIQRARNLFRDGSDRYIKVNCRYVTGTASSPTMRPGPAPSLDLPLPDLLNTTPGSFQADIGTTEVHIQTTTHPLQRAGYLYTLRVNDSESHEYWVLFSNYAAPSAATDLIQVGGPMTFASPEAFANLFDHANGPSWGAGATLLVARCQNYISVPGTGTSDV